MSKPLWMPMTTGGATTRGTALYDFAPAMYVLLDATGMIADVNLTGCRMLGATRVRLIGSPFRSWICHEDRRAFLEHLRRCRFGDDMVESESRVQSKDGGVTPVRLYSKRSWYDGSAVFPTVAVDLTEQLTLEREKRAAEWQRDVARANEAAKDQLIAMVSHELRNPLSPVLTAAHVLASSADLPDSARRLTEVIKRNVEIESKLIDDLLDFARITRGRLELHLANTDAHAVLLEAVNDVRAAAEARGITFDLQLAAADANVYADELRLRQVFWNVLSNAIKFSEPAGRVIVRTAVEPAGRLQIAVRDFGAGMSAETVERLFSPLEFGDHVPDRRSGLGLGLAISRGIVEQHGGRILGSSTGPGAGSTLIVDLPISRAPRTAAPDRASERRAPGVVPRVRDGTGERVLLVEDHEDTGSMLSLYLSRHGYDVTVVATLAAALSALDQPWEIVIADIGLSDGSGLQVARRARLSAKIPRKLVALSGYGAVSDLAASRAAGFHRHLVKPVDLPAMLDILKAD